MSGWHKIAAAAGIAALVSALAWIYIAALTAPAVGTFHDDGVYAVTAQALAHGQGYRISSLPGEPAQTKYPFLFPALLAAVWKVFPEFPANAVWLKLVPFACALLWAALSYRLLREQSANRRWALGLAGLMTLSPWVLFLATTLLSETLFAALLTGTLVLLGRIERGARDWKTLAGAATLASGAFLTRTAGVAVIGAGVLVLLIHAGWRRAGAFLLICAALCAPWIAWQASQRPVPSAAYYSAANYADWNILLHFTAAEKIRILGQNLLAALLSPATLMGVPATAWGTALAMGTGMLMVAGFVRRLRSGPRATEVLVSLYGALIVSWAWPPVRFLAPVLPLLLLYGLEGSAGVCRALHVGVRQTRWALGALALSFILPGGWTLATMAAVAHETGAVVIPNTPYDDWRELSRLASWLKGNTPPEAILTGNLDPFLYLYTGRRGVRGFVPQPYRLHYAAEPGDRPLGTAAEMMRAIDRVHAGYLVCTPNLAFPERDSLARLTHESVQARPERFRLVYQSIDAQYRVYRIASVDSPKNLSDPPNFPQRDALLTSNYTNRIRENGRGKRGEVTHETTN